jgi:hypothetical protein
MCSIEYLELGDGRCDTRVQKFHVEVLYNPEFFHKNWLSDQILECGEM